MHGVLFARTEWRGIVITVNSPEKPKICSSTAFSLVEVTLAIGLAAFSLMGIVGLLPLGLILHHQAMDASVSSQIVEQVVGDVQQADFDMITDPNGGPRQFPVRFFDEQGGAQGDSISPSAQAGTAIYHVAYGVTKPGNSLARVTIDVLNNPGGKSFDRDPATGGIKVDASRGIVPTRFSVSVARNK